MHHSITSRVHIVESSGECLRRSFLPITMKNIIDKIHLSCLQLAGARAGAVGKRNRTRRCGLRVSHCYVRSMRCFIYSHQVSLGLVIYNAPGHISADLSGKVCLIQAQIAACLRGAWCSLKCFLP